MKKRTKNPTSGLTHPAHQVKLLAGRFAQVAAQFPPYKELRERLLALGGAEVVVFPDAESNPGFQVKAQVDVLRVLSRGRKWVGTADMLRYRRKPYSHVNAADLFADQKAEIVTGWSLKDDGLWREHSWGLTLGESPQVIETSSAPSLLFFGYLLSFVEAVCFAIRELGNDPRLDKFVAIGVERYGKAFKDLFIANVQEEAGKSSHSEDSAAQEASTTKIGGNG